MNYKNYVVVIPARKNSKRIKGKNLRKLNGKPLIFHSIEYALKIFNKKNIWVNTDDDLIIDLAKKYGVSTYKRSSKLAEDETSTNDVVLDFSEYLISRGIIFERIITLQPTNPIRSSELINSAIKAFEDSKRKSLMSVSLLHKKFGKIKNKTYKPINYQIGQRHQDLENLYYENGLIYISSKESLLEDKEYITEDVFPFITEEIGSIVDIDYEEDLKLAELIMRKYS
ncbi:acylneuraminate cytidylyltransferase family protein [Flavobacteriaceae bacterium]|nr:acylneuraminate cytidylyltransferase family protein [Flavobacteriaceae bacterium]